MKKWMFLLMVIVMIGSVQAAELILNGDFEEGGVPYSDPNDWTEDFGGYGAFNGATGQPSGLWVLHPGDGGFVGGYYQDIVTVAGKWYQVSLWIQNFGGAAGNGNVKVLVGNPGTGTYTFENGSDTTTKFNLTGLVDQNLTSVGAWAQHAFGFQALGTTTRVGVYNAPFSGLWSTNVDDVSVSETVGITADPVDAVADPDASFTVAAVAADTYQWYKAPGVVLSDSGPYTGSQTATLTVTGATLAEEGQYYCVVSNAAPSQATSASAQLWTQRLMGHWKLDNTILDSVTGTVAGAPVHNGSMVTHDTIIGLDFGGGSTNNFNDITGDGTIGSVIDTGNAVVAGVSVSISGLTWSDYNGHDNGGLPYPFDYSNVDDWAGSSSGDPVTITFTGLNDSKTYDFTLHAGWLGGVNQAMRVSSSDGKVSSVIDTTPTGAPNIATITAASPTGTVLQFTVQTTNGTDTVMNAAALTTSTPAVSPAYDATGIDGSSIQFNNENAYVEIADSDYFNFYPLGFTSSVWYKANTAVGWRIPFSKVSVDPRAGWLFGIDDTVTNDVSLIIEGGGAWISSGPDVDYGDGQWHLMTATYDPADTTLRLYSDGDFVVQSLVDLSLFELASDPVSIGGRFGEHAVSGSIDDARIYSYPLSATEIAELYTNLKPGESVCVKETDAVFESLDQVDDCQITLADFAVFAGRWLDCMLIPA
ncbi:MAG: hypothetical protein ACYSQY_14455, partial [Planctomycetota bacterium]